MERVSFDVSRRSPGGVRVSREPYRYDTLDYGADALNLINRSKMNDVVSLCKQITSSNKKESGCDACGSERVI